MISTVDIPVKYRTKDFKRLGKKYKPGTQFMLTTLREDGEERAKPQRQLYTAGRAFPYHVSCIDENGFRRSFT